MTDSLLDLHLDQVEDQVPVPGGEEYQLKIVSGKVNPSKDGARSVLQVGFEILDHPTAQSVFEHYSFPNESDEDKTVYMMKLNLKQFMQAFGIDPGNPGNPEDWKGLTAWAFLKMDEYDGRPMNRVSRWIQKRTE